MLIGQNVRNKLINADFSIWQRGTSFNLAVSGYTADRFSINSAADGGTLATGTVSRQQVTDPNYLGQPYFYRITNTSVGSSLGTNSYWALSQRIEDVRTFAGKTVTVSIWAAASTAKQMAVYSLQRFGLGGSGDLHISVGSTNSIKTLSSTISRYDFTIVVPSVNGKTIGSGSMFEVGILLQAGSSQVNMYGYTSPIGWQSAGNIDVYKMQVNQGAPADFETAGSNLGHELILCQRFFNTNYPYGTAPGSVSSNGFKSVVITAGAAGENSERFTQTMRTTPIVTLYSSNTGATGVYRDTGAGVDRAASALGVGDSGFSSRLSSTSPSTAGYTFFYTADAEL